MRPPKVGILTSVDTLVYEKQGWAKEKPMRKSTGNCMTLNSKREKSSLQLAE
jgi:hypothetical protein